MKDIVGRRALRQIEEIHGYIAARRVQSADEFLDAFTTIKRRLGEHPLSSPLVRTPDVHQATMAQFPYIVMYRVLRDRITILGVFHAARHPAVRSRP